MNKKEEAFKLRQKGLSFKDIAIELNISKTQAYEYVKELKYVRDKFQPSILKPSSELVPNVRSERTNELKIKEFTGDDLIKKKFDCLNFEGKFLELIGKPSKLFSGIIWGLPKGGKSNFSIRFADYLQEYFGKVAYIAAEEGESVTLQEKFKDIGGSKVTVVETRNRNLIREYLKQKDCDFVFIDSINNAGIDNDFLELIKSENPKKSIIAIVQATKSGTFKGDQALTHNCDFIIKVVNGIAEHHGRFNTHAEVSIFDEPLYQKNPKKKQPESKEIFEKKTEEQLEAIEVQEIQPEPPMPEFKVDLKEINKRWEEWRKLNPPLPVIQPQRAILPRTYGQVNPKGLLLVAGGLLLLNLLGKATQDDQPT